MAGCCERGNEPPCGTCDGQLFYFMELAEVKESSCDIRLFKVSSSST